MFTRLLSSSVLPLFLLAGAAVGHADPTVYSQPYTRSEDTTWDSYTAPDASSATVYDGFTLTAASDVTAVQWQGTYIDHDNLGNNPVAANATSFVVSFYANTNGQPGAQISTATIPVAGCAQTSLGTVGFNAFNDPTTHQIAYYSYRAALPVPFAAAAGQTYWLSIVGNNSTGTPVWSWYASTADDDTTCFQVFGNNRVTRPTDRAFALEGVTAATGVPAISAAATVAKTTIGSGMPGVITLTLPAPVTARLKVKYLLGGTGVNGTDYALLNGKAKFKPGQSSVDVQIVGQGDLGGASKKTVTLTVQSGDGYTVGTTTPVKVKIKPSNVIVLP